ncbi:MULTISPECIES: glycosyl hydrolase family 8 [unclassified Janthinobacterium]|uniref:glycosyl hydrolase family 8 n=1 Tax=unclassified Janthinobacterium TaxID=2610881 RepID=UPI00161523C0|nr:MULTISPECIES: glycosyl hydrolase family 8 [unclassified Janthinobacterium]MBB5371729.1 endo-1,4-beta-D-glucanase Y [Janthinobacterium sp. K2C7]MBB5384534.1 endo-1,4-beta-D-glucanase Y [Janthinobacterium sp. K2Li3]MBB5389810.1 endo-1,4-beta-D-glucanase Y [Janthinobacterium sp. K2E3]
MPAMTHRTLALAIMTSLLAACGGGSDYQSGQAPVNAAEVVTSLAPQPYTAGTIRPNHVTQAQLDQQRLSFYQQWKNKYIAQECGAGRYFVKVNADGKFSGGGTQNGTLTISEAHGYGMLISVLMADEDPGAKTVFDGMVAYFRDHQASSGPGLMAWNQIVGCGNSSDGSSSATDGDLDIAYALLLAHRQWGSTGAINYRQEAQTVLNAIMAREVHPSGKHLLLGDWTGTTGKYGYSTRTSDFTMSHLAAFAASTGDARWSAVRDRSYAIIDTLRTSYSPQTSLVPDFVVNLNIAAKPAASNFLEGTTDGQYSWNASRYPWRVALDYLVYGDQRAFNALTPFNAWARTQTGNNPAKFASGYKLNGTPIKANETNELAFVSALGVAAMIAPENQAWLNAIWTNVQGRTLQQEDYYGNSLKMLTMIGMTGRWAKPQ